MEMMKYAIHPGGVLKATGQRVQVSYEELVKFYQVDANKCFLWTKDCKKALDVKHYIHLYPQPSGRYLLRNVLEGKGASYVPVGGEA